MRKVNLDSLVIELTRKCNAECDHCLRGKAESVDLDPKYLDNLFSKVDYVSTLTFTGGEPSLVPHLIEAALDSAEIHGVDVGNFYIATNAILVSPEFLSAIMHAYLFCTNNEISQVNWSNDQFHPETDETRKLEVFRFAEAKFENDNYDYPHNSIINEGRGADWGPGRPVRREEFTVDSEYQRIEEGTVYLNC